MTASVIVAFLFLSGVLLFIVFYFALLSSKSDEFKEWLETQPPPFTLKGEIVIHYNEETNQYLKVEKFRFDSSTVRGVEGVFNDRRNKRLIYLCYGMGPKGLEDYKKYETLFWEKIFEASPGVEKIHTSTYQYMTSARYYPRFKAIAEGIKSGPVGMGDADDSLM